LNISETRIYVLLLNIIIILIIYNGIKCKEESCNCRSIYLFHLSWTVVEKSESNGWFGGSVKEKWNGAY